MRFPALTVLLTVMVGCSSEPLVTPGTSGDDASTEPDTTATDAAVDVPPADSGCPAPQRITPSDLPSGYMPAERVNLNYTVDGDTAHFFSSSGEWIVRFLYVNTEETSGAEKTAFGEVAKATVDGWLRASTDLKVATRLNSKGAPDLDPFMRRLGLVFVDGELLQTRIMREGLSPYYTVYGCAPAPMHNAFVYAEAEAFANQRGVWKPGHPTDYRKVLADWMGTSKCRPNPYAGPYCK